MRTFCLYYECNPRGRVQPDLGEKKNPRNYGGRKSSRVDPEEGVRGLTYKVELSHFSCRYGGKL